MIKHFFWFWLPPLGYMIAIFSLSALPNPQIGGDTPDYVLHAVEYFLLALLLIRLLLSGPFQRVSTVSVMAWHHACLLGTAMAVLYGISDEIHQYFVPGRHYSLSDIGADAVGAMIAYGVALLDKKFLPIRLAWIQRLQRITWLYALSYAAYR
jgi:hypothetical protein